MDIWALPIIAGPVPVVVYGLAIVVTVVLVWRRPRPRWILWDAVGVLVGAGIAAVAYLVSNRARMFGDPLPHEVLVWAMLGLGGVGLAVASMVGTRAWRRVVAAVGIVVYLVTAVIGINAFYGLNPTLATLFGMSADSQISVPGPTTTGAAPAAPIYQTWQPPAGMPTAGEVGTVSIPGTVSGFDARNAGIYLPPAAQVADAPALPLVIMMMGYPGTPDPTAIQQVLDQFAAKNNGLAPIVIVADQVGPSGSDPACTDSTTYGNAQTYITTDVVNWAKQNLNIIQDPKYWVIAGFSNGGGCAIKYAALFPDLWKNVISVSGEEFSGSENPTFFLNAIYGGDQAKYDSEKPINIMAAAPAGTYAGMTAIFTAGALDTTYVTEAQALADAATKAGMSVTFSAIPNGGHDGTALSGGLTEGFTVLYPVLGLSAPQ